MLGLIESLAAVATDVVKIAIAPVEVAADVARAVTKPIADVAENIVDEVKKSLE